MCPKGNFPRILSDLDLNFYKIVFGEIRPNLPTIVLAAGMSAFEDYSCSESVVGMLGWSFSRCSMVCSILVALG